MRRSLDKITVTISAIQKNNVIGGMNCRIPAIMWPLNIRVMPPRIQLVTGMIAKMMLRIQGNPKLR